MRTVVEIFNSSIIITKVILGTVLETTFETIYDGVEEENHI